MAEENKWITPEGLNPIPIDLSPIIDPVQSVLEKINIILSTTLEILEFVKAFISSLLDPILKIVQEIIKLLKSLLADLNQLGIYLGSDLKIIQNADFPALKGGYLGYQNRMVKRWLKKDPNKPDFKASSAVAVYLYASTDFVEGVEPIIKIINLILGLFKAPVKKPKLPPITGLRVSLPELTEIEKLYGTGEQVVRVSFSVAPKNTQGNMQPNVGGFLIQMSCFEDGLLAGFAENIQPTTLQKDNKTIRTQSLYKIEGATSKHRVYSETVKNFGHHFDGRADTESGGEVGDERRENFLFRNPLDTARITPSKVKEGSTHCFFQTVALALGESEFSVDIPFEKLPKGLTIGSDGSISETDERKISVRVTAVPSDVAREIKRESGAFLPLNTNPTFDFDIKLATDLQNSSLSACMFQVGEKSFVPSFSTFKTSPNIFEMGTRIELEKAIKTALYACFASDFVRVYAKEFFGSYNRYLNLYIELEKRLLNGKPYSKVIAEYEGKNPLEYRRFVTKIVERETKILLAAAPPFLLGIISQFNALVEDTSLREAYTSTDTAQGVFINHRQIFYEKPLTTIIQSEIEAYNTSLGTTNSIPIFFEIDEVNPNTYNREFGGNKQDNPTERDRKKISTPAAWQMTAVNDQNEVIDSPRTAWSNAVPATFHFFGSEGAFELLNQSSNLLSLILNSTDANSLKNSEWLALRFLPNGLPAVEEFLAKSIKFFEAIEDGLKGFGEKLEKAIKLIETRIQQIQALLALIDRVLETLKNLEITFDIPVGVLCHVGTGNRELIQKLITSKEQPTDASSSYTAGAVIVAGGIPTVLLELLQIFFMGEE